MLIGSGVLYVLFADSTLQDWNAPKHALVIDPNELEFLHTKVTNENEKQSNDTEENSDSKCASWMDLAGLRSFLLNLFSCIL